MTYLKKTSLLILATWLMTSCGGAIDPNLSAALLANSGLNLETAVEEDGIELNGEEDDAALTLDLQGASQATEEGAAERVEGLVDGTEDAALIGTGSLGTEHLPVTMSKGDADESCDGTNQGEVLITTDADLPAADLGAQLILKHMFKTALAEMLYLNTTIGQLLDNEESWMDFAAILDRDDTVVQQCQVTLSDETDGDQFGWVVIDKDVAVDFFEGAYDAANEKISTHMTRPAAQPAFGFVPVTKPVEKFSGAIQPKYTIKLNRFTGKREIFVHKSFEGLLK